MDNGLSSQLYFLWDYDLTDEDVQRILYGEDELEKVWMASRLLESARYADIWKYLTLEEVRILFPKLKLKLPVRNAWKYALEVWSTPGGE
jgi:hypothetical protein